MNERIQKLAEQAGALPAKNILNVPGDLVLVGNEEIEAFAELIVKECATICEKYADVLDPLKPEGIADDYFQGGVKSASRRNANAIKKHFGVEE